MNRKGREGETAAVKYLEKNGYKVMERNFRCRRGEVDIIARKDEELVFVEVKNWDALAIDSLEHSLSSLKKQRIIETTQYFIHCHPELMESRIRFDLIFIHGELSKIDHIENAFDGVN
ncbi:MAG: YraN family protein [Spirochaeta sp.]|nr:YraN family protein [Spirochaeta sp.]